MGKRFDEFKRRTKEFGERHRLVLIAGAAAIGSFLGTVLFNGLAKPKVKKVPEYSSGIHFPSETVTTIHPYAEILDENVNDELWENIRDSNHDKVVKLASTLNLCDGENYTICGPGCYKDQKDDEYVIVQMIGGD